MTSAEPTASPEGLDGADGPSPGAPGNRRQSFATRTRQLVHAIREGDDALVQEAVVSLSQTRRLFAPLAFLVGAFAMLFVGLKLLVTTGR